MMGSYKNDHKLISFFGRVNYDWKERYLFTFSLRHEGSSRFGENHKWGNFPAVSVGWRISDEKFMKGLSWIDDLKVRYDYGVTGNQEIGIIILWLLTGLSVGINTMVTVSCMGTEQKYELGIALGEGT